MAQEKASKLKEIKETVTGAAQIMRHISQPSMQESLYDIMGTAKLAKEIIEALKTPEMVRNIENLRLISEKMNESFTQVQDTIKKLEETGVMDQAKGLMTSAKNIADSFGATGQDLHETSTAIKETVRSFRGLVEELKITVIDSKKSGAIHCIDETVKDASNIYKAIFKNKN